MGNESGKKGVKRFGRKGQSKINEEQSQLMRKCHFPCSIKLNGDYAKCFENIPFDKIQYSEANIYKYEFIESEENTLNLGTLEFKNDLEINFMHNDIKFLHQAKNINKEFKKSIFYVGKYILYTLNISPSDITFDLYYKNMFENIAQSNDSDEEKCNQLVDEFQSIGFYVPLQIEIGGKFTFNADNFIKNQNKNSSTYSNINLNMKAFSNENNFFNINNYDLKKIFSSSQILINGGNTQIEDFEEWKKTININNAEVIGYKNLKKIETFIDFKIQNKLKGAINLMNAKYNARKKYFEIIETVKIIKEEKKFLQNSDNSSQQGICETSTSPKIEVIRYQCKSEGQFASKIKRRFSQSFEHIIVGWKIIDRWNDGTNGVWNMNKNPLLSHSIDADFLSKAFRGQHFEIDIYVMAIPK